MFFHIEDYGTQYVMHCNTEEKAEIFLAHLDKIGKKWCNGQSYLEVTDFEIYGTDTVYYFNEGAYGSIGYAKQDGCIILSFDDFEWGEEPIEQTMSFEAFLSGIDQTTI